VIVFFIKNNEGNVISRKRPERLSSFDEELGSIGED
jgi:hypothetical protein